MTHLVIAAGLLFGFVMGAIPSVAADTAVSTIETLYAGQDRLKGQRIRISGRIVKVNNGIMGKNFFHLQDGTGKAGTNDLTVTTLDTVHVGDNVVVTGLVAVNRDFGAGYAYPLILEEASVSSSGH